MGIDFSLAREVVQDTFYSKENDTLLPDKDTFRFIQKHLKEA
jgi:hypothetical protein